MRKLFAAALGLAVGLSVGLSRTPADDAKKIEKPEIEVVYVPTHPKVVQAMLKLANVKEGDTVYDLGCGDGRIPIAAVKDFKAKRGFGLDYNPERLKDCQKSMEEAKLTPEQKKKLTFKQGDVLKLKPEDFKDVDVVTLYLYPSVNLRLKPVLQKGLKPGARVVSHDFDMGDDWKEDKKESVEADRTHTVYLWTIKEKK